MIDISMLPIEIQNKVYKPAPDESYNVELGPKQIYNAGEIQVVDEEEES